MSLEQEMELFQFIINEIDFEDDFSAEALPIPRQKIPVTRRLYKRIKRTQQLEQEKQEEDSAWSKRVPNSWPSNEETTEESSANKLWESHVKRVPEVLNRISEVTTEVALRKRRRSHIDVEVTVAPSPRVAPVQMDETSFSIIPPIESPPGHLQRDNSTSYFSQPENFECNTTYDTDLEYVHNPAFLEQVSREEASRSKNTIPELEPSIVGEETKEEEIDDISPIIEEPRGDSGRRDSLGMPHPSQTNVNYQPSDDELQFTLASDGMIDVGCLQSINMPKNGSEGTTSLMRSLDEHDHFEKDLLRRMADLRNAMQGGFESETFDDVFAADLDAPLTTATERRKSRSPKAPWNTLMFSGGDSSIMSLPDSEELTSPELQRIKLENKRLKEEVHNLQQELVFLKELIGDEPPPVSNFFNSIRPPMDSDAESSDVSDLSQLTIADIPEISNAISSLPVQTQDSRFVFEWLSQIQCESYFDKFLAQGINTMSKIRSLNGLELEKMGIPLDTRLRILHHLQQQLRASTTDGKEQPVHSKEQQPVQRKGIPLSTLWYSACRFVERYNWIWQPAFFFACIVINIDFFEAPKAES